MSSAISFIAWIGNVTAVSLAQWFTVSALKEVSTPKINGPGVNMLPYTTYRPRTKRSACIKIFLMWEYLSKSERCGKVQSCNWNPEAVIRLHQMVLLVLIRVVKHDGASWQWKQKERLFLCFNTFIYICMYILAGHPEMHTHIHPHFKLTHAGRLTFENSPSLDPWCSSFGSNKGWGVLMFHSLCQSFCQLPKNTLWGLVETKTACANSLSLSLLPDILSSSFAAICTSVASFPPSPICYVNTSHLKHTLALLKLWKADSSATMERLFWKGAFCHEV